MRIEKMLVSDIAEALEIEALCFSVPWSEAMLRSELENPACFYFAAREDGRLIGYAGMLEVLDEAYVNNIATRPKFQNMGVASALMEEMVERARARGDSFLSLEVRAGNASAIALYRKYGFTRTGLRQGYYERPREDALIMTRFFKINKDEM